MKTNSATAPIYSPRDWADMNAVNIGEILRIEGIKP